MIVVSALCVSRLALADGKKRKKKEEEEEDEEERRGSRAGSRQTAGEQAETERKKMKAIV